MYVTKSMRSKLRSSKYSTAEDVMSEERKRFMTIAMQVRPGHVSGENFQSIAQLVAEFIALLRGGKDEGYAHGTAEWTFRSLLTSFHEDLLRGARQRRSSVCCIELALDEQSVSMAVKDCGKEESGLRINEYQNENS